MKHSIIHKMLQAVSYITFLGIIIINADLPWKG